MDLEDDSGLLFKRGSKAPIEKQINKTKSDKDILGHPWVHFLARTTWTWKTIHKNWSFVIIWMLKLREFTAPRFLNCATSSKDGNRQWNFDIAFNHCSK